MAQSGKCDIAILGGGLAGGLLALALRHRKPDLSILLIEADDTIGGNHLWSFFESDIAPADRWLVAPLVCHSWQGHEVIFPRHSRALPGAYHSIRSERLDEIVRSVLPSEAILTGRRVHTAGPTSVLLDDGRRIDAGGVIDARGTGDLGLLDLGWQKFVGQELRLAKPHGLTKPMIMDATVEQIDGYRFVYVLPVGSDRLFVEDTYYSDRAFLTPGTISPRISHYAAGRGWRVAEVMRQETGALPVVMGGDFEAYWRSGGDGVAKIGLRAGLFHHVTGYSLPDAVRTASRIAALDRLDGESLHAVLHAEAQNAWNDRAYYRMLSRMLFRAALPAERWKIFAQFYRRDHKLIARFYRGKSSFSDKLRILAGKPPVPIGRALRAIGGKI